MDDSIVKCIAKSHSSFPLNIILRKHTDLVNIFSGHATSALFTLKKDNVDEFIDIINNEVFKLNARPKGKIIDVIDVKEEEITLESVKELLQNGFAIYKNDTCFRLKKIRKDILQKSVNGYHISGSLNENVTLVGYKLAGEYDKIDKEYIDIIFRPEINEFHNSVGVTLHIYFID